MSFGNAEGVIYGGYCACFAGSLSLEKRKKEASRTELNLFETTGVLITKQSPAKAFT